MASSIRTPVVEIAPEHQDLFKSINSFVYDYMSSPSHDNSHDYHHILRVLSNANKILQATQEANPRLHYDSSVVHLAALLHDVGDHKYAKPGEDLENQISNLLVERGAPNGLALKVQMIVKNVGYTNEVKNPETVQQMLKQHPELAIVQDADRLDAIGAIGVARCFAFSGAKRQGQPMAVAIDHFEEKLLRLPGMMKTKAGKEMAEKRQRRLQDFADQFNDEAELSFQLE